MPNNDTTHAPDGATPRTVRLRLVPCQPAGSMVATPSGPRPIETIDVGDAVVSCDMRSSAFIQKGKIVDRVAVRPFAGDLIRVTSGDNFSDYTPNHGCVVRFSGVRDRWCVYLQRRGDQFRIGKAAMDYAGIGGGPVARSRAEGADAVWIIELFGEDRDAYVAEATLSGKFGISQLRFADGASSKIFPQPTLDRVWVDIGSNRGRAIALLDSIGQDERLPLFNFASPTHQVTGGGSQASLKRPIVVRACNLLDGVESMHYIGMSHYRSHQWQSCTVSRVPYEGPVYALGLEKYGLYVADGLLTRT